MYVLFLAAQIQTKRELFFKGDGAGIISSSPSVPSVPPPQPPTQPPGSQVNNSSSATVNTTQASNITSPNAAPVYSSGVVSTIPNAKPRLPPAVATPIPNDASEDSNRRETARTAVSSTKEDSNKEASLLHHARPTPPTKPKELDGYVGFANLPNQVYRKAVKKGFEFTLMVVGR